MDALSLITAFGGGAFGAAIGGTNAFIFTGIFAICGSVAGMCGYGDVAGFVMGNIAFGSFFGPHIGFTGGVGAAAYAKKRGYMENGADTVTPLVKFNKPDILIVGGVVGVIGYLLKVLIVDNVFAGTVSKQLITDGPGIIVFCFAVVIRLVFGGKFRTGTGVLSKGSAFGNVIVIGLTYGIVTAGIFASCANASGDVAGFCATYGGYFHTLMFGLAAVGLLIAVAGHPYYAHHHIMIITAEATVQSMPHVGYNPMTAFAIGVVFGIITAILFDLGANVFNSGTDSHIDPPAFSIFIMTFVVNAVFPAM
ncbi:MAG: hypothetical protein K5989_01995 [Lachnospiraceae bacterium]|nr:hypothetical protein [Lachnospiraceae bacterium]